MIIDKANAFYLKPTELSADTYTESTAVHYDSSNAPAVQEASNILDFGPIDAQSGFTKHPARRSDIAANLIVRTSGTSGSVKLQECADISVDEPVWSDVAGSTVTVSAAGTYSIPFPALTKRYVKAVLTTLTASNTEVYMGAVSDEAI